MNYVRQHRVGGPDMYYRTQLITKRSEYKKGFVYVEPETKNSQKLPGTYERNEINNAFREGVENKADEKGVKTFLTTPLEKTFSSELNEFLGYTNIKNIVGNSLSGKLTNSTAIDKKRF